MSITLFTTSILVAVARTIIRLHYQKRLFFDDVFLAIAVLSLCAALILLFFFSSSMYMIEMRTIENPSDETPSPQLIAELSRYSRLSNTYIALLWSAIYSVKFSFLFFSRVLVRRLRTTVLYWRAISVVTIVTWAYAVVTVFMNCPHLGPGAREPRPSISLAFVTFHD